MVDEGEDLEPLFDYHRVQPVNFVCLDDDDSDCSETPVPKRAKSHQNTIGKIDKDEKVIKEACECDDDWLPPPPKVNLKEIKNSVEDSTIKALRTKKMELLSFTKTVAADVMEEVEKSAKREIEASPRPVKERPKIVISIQDKDGQKQFRIYADEKFERLFKMYSERAKLDPQGIVFSFDGEKIDPHTTPCKLGMEDDDMIEVHIKKC